LVEPDHAPDSESVHDQPQPGRPAAQGLPVADAALHYASIRADLKRRGALIGGNGLLIAAHARSLGLTLVTNNTGEFGRVADLAVENWTLPRRRR
jgi:hypothetical protein